MDIWDQSKLVLFVAFVVPGFIAIKAYELFLPFRETDSSKQVIDAVAYSCLNYALLLWPIYAVEANGVSDTHPNLYVLFWVIVLFIAPILLVVAWKYLRERDFVQNAIPHPTQKPWDYVFGKRHAYWVIVTLKGGEKVGGMYGPSSFASSAPAEEQIFLEEEWLLNEDGGFDRAVEQTAGVIILSSEIQMVEFFNSGEVENEQQAEQG